MKRTQISLIRELIQREWAVEFILDTINYTLERDRRQSSAATWQGSAADDAGSQKVLERTLFYCRQGPHAQTRLPQDLRHGHNCTDPGDAMALFLAKCGPQSKVGYPKFIGDRLQKDNIGIYFERVAEIRHFQNRRRRLGPDHKQTSGFNIDVPDHAGLFDNCPVVV